MQIAMKYITVDNSLTRLKHASKCMSAFMTTAYSVSRRLERFDGMGTNCVARLKEAIIDIDKQSSSLEQLYKTGNHILAAYIQCENKLAGHEACGICSTLTDDSHGTVTASAGGTVIPITGNDPLTSVLGILAGGIFDVYDNIGSGLGKLKDYSGLASLVFDSEFLEKINFYSDELGDNNIFKCTGYIADAKDLLEAISAGDMGKLDDLSEKYAKKGIKLITESVLGTTVVTAMGSACKIYIDLGWNIGESIAEGVQEFIQEPSASALAKTIWGATGGAFVDTGLGLAEDVLDFVYSLVGKEFDEADFQNAMDYLGDAIVDTTTDACVTLLTGLQSAGKTVASWLDWF